MTNVYLLWHAYEIEPGRDEEMLIGVYTSHELAEAAKKRMSEQPGFRDHPDDFEIAEYKLDQDHWTQGFVTVD
jgi:hypothetical protein